MKTFRPYQWDAIRDLSGHLWDGERRVALIAPTGAGKSIIIACLLKRVSQAFKSAVIATPFVQVEESFSSIKDDTWIAEAPQGTGSVGTPTTFTFKDFFFHRKDDDYWTESRPEFKAHVRSEDPKFFTLITTHHAVARWGIEEMSEDLTGRILVLDEAHHAGSDDEDKESRAIAKFANEWHKRGGTVIYCTATPYRADDLDVLPEGTVPHIWSMADHAASGFAPSDFRVETENLETEIHTPLEFTGDVLSPEEAQGGQAYRQMVDRWVQDGRPKAVFIVPSRNSRAWAARLETELKDRGARTLNVVGAEAGIKSNLIQALEQERKVRRFEDSQWDVIVCCKRFDEGTDWPLASAVYNYGIPSSFGLTIQRWGRSFRDKSGIEGHTHPNIALMVFFVPRIAEDARKHFEKFHHEYTSLLACYLARWTTAQPFGREMRNRGEGPWVRRPRHKDVEVRDLDEIRDEQTFQVTDYEQAQADRLLVRFETKFKVQHGREPSLGEKVAHLEEVKAPTRVLLAARLNLLEQLPLEAQEQYRARILAALKRRQSLSRRNVSLEITADPELRALFIEAIEPYRDQTFSMAGAVFAVQSRFTGQTAQEIEKELAQIIRPDLSEDMIVEAAQRHFNRTGKWPSQGEDATDDFNHLRSWSGVDAWLSSKRNTTLHRLLVARGLTVEWRPEKPTMFVEDVIEAVRRHILQTGQPPSREDGPTDLFGYPTTWMAVSLRLRKLGTSLPLLLIQQGFKDKPSLLTKEAVIEAARRHHARTGCWPDGTDLAPAPEDFGYQRTWCSVGQWVFRRGWPSLHRFLIDQGVKTDIPKLTIPMIMEAAHQHYRITGRWPAAAHEGASEAFGHPRSWEGVQSWLRARDLSLSKLRTCT